MKTLRNRIIASALLLVIMVAASVAIYMSQETKTIWPKNNTQKKVVVLGFDGTEHTLLEQWVAEGKLPNIAKLMNAGSYSTLATTTPAQSPVAWSSFATGTNPGKHNVMDFIARDPETYTPIPGIANVETKKFGKPVVTSTQKGQTFWDILSTYGIKSKIIQVPITFPAKDLNGSLLTGLGTPDASGTFGTFSFYTTTDKAYKDSAMSYNLFKLENIDKQNTKIQGLDKYSNEMTINRNEDSVDLKVGNSNVNIKEGQWSDYVEIDFNLLGPFYVEHGVGRFYLEESRPDLKLYLSPISFDPAKPFFKISSPDNYSKTLSEENGTFKTVGVSVDLWALNEERISDEVFMEDLNQTLDEEERIMKSEMAKDDWNVYVQVFQATDLVQHMFWRYLDPTNPRYNINAKYKDAILTVYERMDKLIGEVQAKLSADTTLMVMSDHGFASYNKSIDINAWLVDNGYMVLKDPSKKGSEVNDIRSGEEWKNVDWAKTKAYAVGFGSIYINLEGREGQGIVTNEEYSAVRNEIKDKLAGLKDGSTPVIAGVYKREDVMHGEYLGNAADLIVTFNSGYRVSWQTTFGATQDKQILVNNNKYSGDHISIDPKLVPGIFISNNKFDAGAKGIMDIAPTILNLFGITRPAEMDGKVLD